MAAQARLVLEQIQRVLTLCRGHRGFQGLAPLVHRDLQFAGLQSEATDTRQGHIALSLKRIALCLHAGIAHFAAQHNGARAVTQLRGQAAQGQLTRHLVQANAQIGDAAPSLQAAGAHNFQAALQGAHVGHGDCALGDADLLDLLCVGK